MNEICTKDFWKAAGRRALRSFCQGLLTGIGTAAAIEEVPWVTIASTAGLMTIVSLLTSIVMGLPEVRKEDDEKC